MTRPGATATTCNGSSACADRLGSLDVGKTANIVMADGDPLDVRTTVKQVFIGNSQHSSAAVRVISAEPLTRLIKSR